MLEEFGIGFVPFSNLGLGFLTGTGSEATRFEQGDFRRNLSRFAAYAYLKSLAQRDFDWVLDDIEREGVNSRR